LAGSRNSVAPSASRRISATFVEVDLEPLLLQDAGERLGDLDVHRRRDAVEILDDGDLGAEAAVDRPHLEADVAAADHHHVPGHLGQRERLGRGDDNLAVGLHAR